MTTTQITPSTPAGTKVRFIKNGVTGTLQSVGYPTSGGDGQLNVTWIEDIDGVLCGHRAAALEIVR